MNNTKSCLSEKPPEMLPEPPGKLVLHLKGLGNTPSFKNKKRAIVRPGATFATLITHSKTKKWMTQAIAVFACQLSSLCRIGGYGTTPECLKRFAIASCPQDDNWQVLEIGSVKTRLVPKGEEGAIVTLEPL